MFLTLIFRRKPSPFYRGEGFRCLCSLLFSPRSCQRTTTAVPHNRLYNQSEASLGQRTTNNVVRVVTKQSRSCALAPRSLRFFRHFRAYVFDGAAIAQLLATKESEQFLGNLFVLTIDSFTSTRDYGASETCGAKKGKKNAQDRPKSNRKCTCCLPFSSTDPKKLREIRNELGSSNNKREFSALNRPLTEIASFKGACFARGGFLVCKNKNNTEGTLVQNPF